MIPSAVYAAAETPNAFQCARQPQEIAPFRGAISTPFNAWFLWFKRVNPRNDISIGSGVFAGLTRVRLCNACEAA